MLNLGNDIFQKSIRLAPRSSIPLDIEKGDIIFLEGHPDYEIGLYLCMGSSKMNDPLMLPIVDHKEIKKFLKKNK